MSIIATIIATAPPCECPLAGFCLRHQRQKTPHLHKLCRTRAAYRALWDGQVQPPRGPCVHLGEMTRLERCPTCNGGWQVKVFACRVFGETTLGKELPGVACCSGCAEYRAG